MCLHFFGMPRCSWRISILSPTGESPTWNDGSTPRSIGAPSVSRRVTTAGQPTTDVGVKCGRAARAATAASMVSGAAASPRPTLRDNASLRPISIVNPNAPGWCAARAQASFLRMQPVRNGSHRWPRGKGRARRGSAAGLVEVLRHARTWRQQQQHGERAEPLRANE